MVFPQIDRWRANLPLSFIEAGVFGQGVTPDTLPIGAGRRMFDNSAGFGPHCLTMSVFKVFRQTQRQRQHGQGGVGMA